MHDSGFGYVVYTNGTATQGGSGKSTLTPAGVAFGFWYFPISAIAQSWLRSPIPSDKSRIVAALANGSAGTTSGYDCLVNQLRGVAFGFQVLSCFETTHRMVALSASFQDGTSESNNCIRRGRSDIYVFVIDRRDRKVRRRVRLQVSPLILHRIIWWLRSPWPTTIRFRGTASDGTSWPTSDSGGYNVSNARGVAFGFRKGFVP